MKKFSKKASIIASSVATIAVCSSLVVGSTFALFTSEDSVNIAVTSGSIDVTATIANEQVESPSSINLDGTVPADAAYAKSSEAAAKFQDGKLTVEKVLPGDKVTFDIVVSNAGKNSAKYNYVLDCLSGYTLMDQFVVSVKNGETVVLDNETNLKKYASAWSDTFAAGASTTYSVTMELPGTVGNAYKGITAELSVLVHAVQANANVSGEAVPEKFNKIGADADLTTALTEGGAYIATSDLELTTALNLTENTVASLDLNGNTLTPNGSAAKEGAPIAAKGNSSLTIANGTIKPKAYRWTQSSVDQYDTASITLDNVTIEPLQGGYKTYGYGVTAHGSGTVTINNSTIKSGCAVSTNASKPTTPTITINDSVLEGYATGLLFNVPGTLIVNKSEIVGINQGLFLRAGSAILTDSTIRATLIDTRSGALIEITEAGASNTFNPYYESPNDWKDGTQTIPLAALVIGCARPNQGYANAASATLINTKVDESDEFIAAKEVGLIHHAILAWNYFGEGNGSATVSIDAASQAKLNGTVCTVVGTSYDYAVIK